MLNHPYAEIFVHVCICTYVRMYKPSLHDWVRMVVVNVRHVYTWQYRYYIPVGCPLVWSLVTTCSQTSCPTWARLATTQMDPQVSLYITWHDVHYTTCMYVCSTVHMCACDSHMSYCTVFWDIGHVCIHGIASYPLSLSHTHTQCNCSTCMSKYGLCPIIEQPTSR